MNEDQQLEMTVAGYEHILAAYNQASDQYGETGADVGLILAMATVIGEKSIDPQATKDYVIGCIDKVLANRKKECN